EAPLTAPEVALARQESVAEQALGALQRAPLHEARVVRDEHVFNVVGVVEEIDGLRRGTEARHVAVLARHPREQRERITAELYDVAERPEALWPRRLGARGYHLV